MKLKIPKEKEFAAISTVFFGLLLFPVIQGISSLFLQEGLITLWVSKSLKIGVVKEVLPEHEIIPPPDLTRPFAVMIDNHPNALPQSGLTKAEYVFEVLVEGGLTRLMAVFKSREAKEIGPVRSARPYYLEYAREFDAVYAHVGGSDESLVLLRKNTHKLDDADQFRHGGTYWRDRSLYAPHNVFTSSEAMRELIAEQEWEEMTTVQEAAVRSEVFKDSARAEEVTVTPTRASRDSVFRWNVETASYDRWLFGEPALGRDDETVSPKTLVVMELDADRGRDPFGKGLLAIDTVGSGKATVFRNGKLVEGRWRKNSLDDQTQFFYENGRKIPFDFGQVWISVIAPNRGGTVEFK